MKTLVSGCGRSVVTGEKIGSGGEGAVFNLHGSEPNQVAKLYHQPLTFVRQQKLRAMSALTDPRLAAVTAWPQDFLRSRPDGPIVGFIMADASRYHPLHHLYGPSHRKRLFPEKDWRFLIHTARNIAAAVEVIHRLGLVIGDINPNSIRVAGDGTVKLIDCDSFQLQTDGKTYLCEVGVPHFTPPELQNQPSFTSSPRTRNHDNFGLAVLIFHLLLMGRHPYSGVYLKSGDMPLEKAIAEFRYAYGDTAHSKAMAPPPNSVPPGILPSAINRLFEHAFREHGAIVGRPSSGDWLSALTILQQCLRACAHEPCHYYSDDLSSCPWCHYEQFNGAFYFISHDFSIGGLSHFNLADEWAAILQVPFPGPLPDIVTVQPLALALPPLPPALNKAKNWRISTRIISVLVVLTSIAFPALMPFLLPAAGFLFFWQSPALTAAIKTRTDELATARRSWRRSFRYWQKKADSSRFEHKLNELNNLKQALENLPNRLIAEKQKLQANLAEYQKHHYLDQFFLADHAIKSIGPARKATLASFGIETAADITAAKISKIPGFGAGRTKALVDWRQTLERSFVFAPNRPIQPADRVYLNQRYAKKRQLLEQRLLQGVAQLAAIREDIVQQRVRLRPATQAAALQLAHAEAELARLR